MRFAQRRQLLNDKFGKVYNGVFKEEQFCLPEGFLIIVNKIGNFVDEFW